MFTPTQNKVIKRLTDITVLEYKSLLIMVYLKLVALFNVVQDII